MKASELREVMACLPKGKTHFRYFRYAYAPGILSKVVDGRVPVREVRKSSFGKLLDNPLMKDFIAGCGSGVLDPEALRVTWKEPSLPYLLTVSRWQYDDRYWSQVSRSGNNLVLQLNMPQSHKRFFSDSMGEEFAFNPCWGHPVQTDNGQHSFRDTLAWARIDVDFETGEALVEEIQSDSVRRMGYLKRRILKCKCKSCAGKRRYLQWFEQHSEMWSETMMAAVVEFIYTELGIRTIFGHTARSGWRVKRMKDSGMPPVSLYSTLPKKFAFRHVWNAPSFLLNTRSYNRLVRHHPDIDFYMLDFTTPVSAGGRCA